MSTDVCMYLYRSPCKHPASGAGQPNLPSTYGPQLSRAVEVLEDHPRVVGQATHHGGIELQPLAHTCTERIMYVCMYG